MKKKSMFIFSFAKDKVVWVICAVYNENSLVEKGA